MNMRRGAEEANRDSADQEIRDRLRRIETRLTKFLEHVGFDTQTKRPEWIGDGVITIPSLHVQLKEVLDTIPPDYDDEVGVWHKDKLVISMRR